MLGLVDNPPSEHVYKHLHVLIKVLLVSTNVKC